MPAAAVNGGDGGEPPPADCALKAGEDASTAAEREAVEATSAAAGGLPAPPPVPGQRGGEPPPAGAGKKKKKQKKKKKKKKTTRAGPSHGIKRIHDLLHTLPAVTKSANYENIRTEEHSGYAAFGEAAEELGRCLMKEKAPSTFGAKPGLDKPAWDEDGGTEQARAILWELYITDYAPVLNAIDNMCNTGSPSYHADLQNALRLQCELFMALANLKLPRRL